ncbi:MAG: hypothetical protein K2Y37_13505 [Pirellulales bacterium]|nr:hypothetical protein [Pirellulales bacterium]
MKKEPLAFWEGTMGKKILGWVLIVWMTGAIIGAIPETLKHSGDRLLAEIAVILVMVALAAIGVTLVKGKKPPPPNTEQGSKMAAEKNLQ